MLCCRDHIRDFAEESEIDSLGMLLDTTQQYVALVAQATAWTEARAVSTSSVALGPDDEGSFLHADVRSSVLPRLSLTDIAAVLDKLEPRSDPSESRNQKVQRQAAEGLLRRRARELAQREAQ